MFILNALNITGNGRLQREDGTADYEVWVGINHHCIWKGNIDGHIRDHGASALLRLIADAIEKDEKK